MRSELSCLRPDRTCPRCTEAPISGSACAYLLPTLLQTLRAKAWPDASLSRRLIKSGSAGGGRLGVLGRQWRSISSCFSFGKKKKFSINFLRCCQTCFLFRNFAALSEVAVGGKTGQWSCSPALGEAGPHGQGSGTYPRASWLAWTSVPHSDILEHSLAGSRHSTGICGKNTVLST